VRREQQAGRQLAPPPLDLLQEFVNTVDLETKVDRLDLPATLAKWCRDHHLLEPSDSLYPADLTTALRAREALRRVALAHSGWGDVVAANQELAFALRNAQLRPVASAPATSLSLQPTGTPQQRLLGALAAAALQGAASGDLKRLKACVEDECQWLFWDASKNGSGRWCSMAVCGSRAKARAYQRRLRDRRG
jgi:predicted RNA-binding Zn ribbon-like protein